MRAPVRVQRVDGWPVRTERGRRVGPLRQRGGVVHRGEGRAGGGGEQRARVPGRQGGADRVRHHPAPAEPDLVEDGERARGRIDAHRAPAREHAERGARRERNRAPGRPEERVAGPGRREQLRVVANSGAAILFRFIAAVLVILTMLSVSPAVVGWVPGIAFEPTMGALVLLGMGLLHLGLTTHPLRVIFGLFTVLSGFEILYAAVEVSALVGGLLAVVTLGLALLGAYFFLSTGAEGSE